MNKNPWHEVTFGENVPGIVNGIIEIPKGSRAKCELEKDSGILKLDRVLFSSVILFCKLWSYSKNLL